MISTTPVATDPLILLEGWLDEGQPRAVLDWYQSAAPAWLEANPEASVLVATAAARTGDYALANALADRARAALESIGDTINLFRAHNVLGGVAMERGRLEEAKDHFERAQVIAAQLGEASLLARVATNMASIRHLRGDAWAAERLYHRALRWFEQIEDRRGQAQTHINLTIVARDKHQCEAAIGHASRAIALAEMVGDPGLLGMALTNRAETALAAGGTESEALLDRARALAEEAGDPLGMVEVDRLRASWHLSHARPQQAVEAAEAARTSAKQLGALLARADSATASAEAWERADQPLLAEARRDEAALLAELLGMKSNSKQRPRMG